MTADCPESFLALATELADAAGKIVRAHFRQPVTVDQKADQTPVTIADRGAEAAMRDLIRERLPEHGVIGEEEGAENEGASHLWVLDPVDGTKRFITGNPLFGTLIATYALLGFANFASIAIQIGGIGGIAPDRRSDLSRLGIKAMIGGNLAAFMSASLAGMIL